MMLSATIATLNMNFSRHTEGVLLRALSTSNRSCAKPGYFLNRLLEKEKVILKKMQDRNETVFKSVKHIPSQETRRQKVLNNLYLESISDVLANEFSTELEALKIRIEGIRITFDLRTVKVYWASDITSPVDKETMDTLKAIEPKLRKELISVRHMGIIPAVRFVHYCGSPENTVFKLLQQLKEEGELQDVGAAVPLCEKSAPVYGLDREKIMSILAKKTLPADAVSSYSTPLSTDLNHKNELLRNIRRKVTKSKKFSLKDDFRWQDEAYKELNGLNVEPELDR